MKFGLKILLCRLAELACLIALVCAIILPQNISVVIQETNEDDRTSDILKSIPMSVVPEDPEELYEDGMFYDFDGFYYVCFQSWKNLSLLELADKALASANMYDDAARACKEAISLLNESELSGQDLTDYNELKSVASKLKSSKLDFYLLGYGCYASLLVLGLRMIGVLIEIIACFCGKPEEGKYFPIKYRLGGGGAILAYAILIASSFLLFGPINNLMKLQGIDAIYRMVFTGGFHMAIPIIGLFILYPIICLVIKKAVEK